MGRRAAQTAAVEIDWARAVQTGEHDAPIEGILALMDQAELEQEVDRISLPDHVAIEHAAGGISDAELFDQFLVMHATAVKVLPCLGMPAELLLIELDGFAQRFLLPRLGRAE